MYIRGGREFPHIERIEIGILVGGDEVKGLDRIKTDLVVLGLHDQLTDGRIRTNVVQHQTSIASSGGKNILLNLEPRYVNK